MVLAGTAVMMSDDGVDAAPSGDTTYLSGAITATQEYGTGTNVVVNGNLTIPSGMSMIISDNGKLTIEAGTTLTIEAGGQLILQGTPTIIVNGNIVAEGTSDNADYKGAIINNTTYNSEAGTGIIVSGSIALQKGAEISTNAGGFQIGNYDVDSYEGGNGSILLNNGASFSVTQQSRYVSEIGNQDILMNVGSTVTINGKITGTVGIDAVGAGTYYTAGGIDLGVVSGSTTTPDLVFTVSSQNTSALVTADAKNPITLKQYILNVDGTLDGATMASTQGTYNGSNAFYETSGYGYKYFPTVSIADSLAVVDGRNNVTVGNESTVSVSGIIEFEYDDKVTAHSTATINGSLLVSGTMSGSYDTGFLTISQDTTHERIVVNGGTMALTIVGELDVSDLAQFANAHLYGTMYQVDGGTGADDVIYIQDFDDAVAGAIAGESSTVTVFAWGAHNKDYNAQEAADRGAYVVTSDITIPDGLGVVIQNALIIGDGATMTIEEGASITFEGLSREKGPAVLWVEGKVVDYDGIMSDYENTDLTTADNGIFMYEVKKTTDTDSEYYVTYTTLKIALSEAQAGETIDLNGCVTIDENMTIPEGVTVAADFEETETTGIIVAGATLTVNGVLDMNYTQFDLTTKTGSETVGNIIVNNYVADVSNGNYQVWGVDGSYLDGAYFNGIVGDAETESNYISTVEIAANASGTVTDSIRIFGNVNMGDVEFTASEDLTNGLTVYIYNDDKDVATAGTITINSNVRLNTDSGDLTGTIAGAGATITVEGNKDTTFTVVTIGADDQATTQMQISSMVRQNNTGVATSDGSITISSGTVYIVATFNTDDMTVAEGATLVIADTGALNADANPSYRFNTTPGNMPLLTESLASNLAGVTVDGTITVEGQMSADVVYINGTVAIADTGSFTSSFLAYINGTVTSEEGAAANYVVALVNGTISGDVNAEFVAAFPGSDVSGADIVAPGTTGINSTNYYVNGEQIATVYAENGVAGEIVLLLTDVNGVKYDTSRFYIDSAMTDCVTDFNTDDGTAIYDAINDVITGFRAITYDSADDSYDLTDFRAALDAVTGNFDVGDYENVYIGMEPADVTGTISVGTGLNLYIDSLSWSPNALGAYQLGVGTHTVSFDVSTGYDGSNATITFNGQTVQNGGTIEITADMTSFTLVVSGAVPSSGGTVVIDNGSGDSGMGLTDYLLIILVVLIVIMAIIVALRLMRS